MKRRAPGCALARVAGLGAAMLAAWPAYALYKIVGPDGRVTYTDRAPTASQGRATTLSDQGMPLPEPALPAELQQSVQRYPVTLYTAAACPPCDEARQWLRQRGVPHAEKSVQSDEDRLAWIRMIGSLEAPALTVGSQMLRGFAPDTWNQYLDAAGYPRDSKLPPNFIFAAPVPLVAPKPAEPARAAPAPEPPPAEVPGDAPPPGFRF